MRSLILAALLLSSGCSKILGFDSFTEGDLGDDVPPDDGSGSDTIDTPPGSTFRVSGKVRGSTNIDEAAVGQNDVVVQYFDRAGTMHEEVASDPSGDYALELTPVGGQVDGFLHLTNTNWRDTYVHFPAPLTGSTSSLPTSVYSTANIMQLASEGSVIPQTARAAVLVIVRTAAGAPVAGATITMDNSCASGSCGDLIYTNAQGHPDISLTSTSAAGLAYAFSIPEGGYEPYATLGGTDFGGRYYGIGDGTMVIIQLVKP